MADLSNLKVAHQGSDDGFDEAASQPRHAVRKQEFDAAVDVLEAAIDAKADGDHRHDNATPAADGFLSSADKAKLNALSLNVHWRAPVATQSALPLGVDPVGACRIVLDEQRIYLCVAQTGTVSEQWAAMGSLSPVTVFTAVIGDGETTDFTVAHNLNSAAITFSVREEGAGGKFLLVESLFADPNTLLLKFGSAPAANTIRVTVQG